MTDDPAVTVCPKCGRPVVTPKVATKTKGDVDAMRRQLDEWGYCIGDHVANG